MARRSGRTLLRFPSLVLTLLVMGVVGYAEPLPDLPSPSDPLPPLSLSFVGDIMHHQRNADMSDYDRLYDSVRRLLQVDDLSFANIEFPVDPGQPAAGYPLFNGSVAYLEAAVRGGFDVFALANNHTWDLGAGGAAATQGVIGKLTEQWGIHANGIRAVRDATITPTAMRIRGWRVGFVSIASFSNVPGSSRSINLVNYFDPGPRAAFLQQVRRWAEEFDLLILGVHAGEEYRSAPADHKAAFLRDLSDAGAHIVWSHHPHVLQPWERRNGGLIIHSAGNFISAQRRHQSPHVPVGRWAPTGDTAIYQVRVESSRPGPASNSAFPAPDVRAVDGSRSAGVRVTTVRTPFFTMHDDEVHGLVLRSFEQVLSSALPLPWRAFYLARFAALGNGQPLRRAQ